MRGRIVERVVKRGGQRVEDRLGRSFGRKQRVPGRRLELRKPGLLRCRHLWQRRIARAGADCIGLERAGANVLNHVGGDVAHVIDLAGDQRGNGGRGAVEGHQGWFGAKNRVEQQAGEMRD